MTTMRQYVDARMNDHKSYTQDQLRILERERDLAYAALERRLHALNELRTGVLTRAEYDAKHESLSTELLTLRSRMDELSGARERGSKLQSAMISVVAVIVTFAAVVSPHIH